MAELLATLSVCSDCLQFLANGPDDIDSDALEAIEAGLAKQGGHCVPACGDDCGGFSWTPCDLCERPLGGERHAAAVLGNKESS